MSGDDKQSLVIICHVLLLLLGICFWRGGFEAAFGPDRMGEKGGRGHHSPLLRGFHSVSPVEPFLVAFFLVAAFFTVFLAAFFATR